MTNTTNGVPSDTQCYGVVIGYNNRVWAMFNGGLSYTDDDGISWTTLTPSTVPAFSYTGLTDGNWNRSAFLVADRSHPEQRLAVVVGPPLVSIGQNKVLWWSYSYPTVTDGPSWSSLSSSPHYGYTTCSRYGGLWLTTGGTVLGSQYRYIMTFGS